MSGEESDLIFLEIEDRFPMVDGVAPNSRNSSTLYKGKFLWLRRFLATKERENQ
jgi:hypothetical protein